MTKQFTRMATRFVATTAVALGMGLCSTAHAASIDLAGNADPNLQATLDIMSLTNGSITFSVTNVLVPGVTSSITGIGFALPGTITANSPATCGPALAQCNNFTLTPTVDNTPGNVPQFPAAVLDFAIITGPAFTGGNPPGINQGSQATFTVTGNFTGLTQEDFLTSAYLRFQSVSDPAFPNVGSDVAVPSGDPGGDVPEPTSVALLGVAALVGRAVTRRARLAAVTEP